MDPKAIQYIFQNSVDNFHLDRERNFFSEVLLGNALPVIDGEKHKRQRKVRQARQSITNVTLTRGADPPSRIQRC